MHLKHLTINGFKSFAKKSELEFVSAVTAIVGPNGSGKSNVAEAFRFVLGEQSNKGMRAKSGADLIFNGSEKVSRSGRAAVEVVLENSSRVFPLDFDEVKIERVVHRDGQNDYLINGSKVRLKDVQEVLAAANIGPSGHHIISQGEADRVLSASPRERREMIEDALGLKVFQFKKQEAERKLKKTAENIAQVELLRREVAPHLQHLERQMKKMARAVELREELTVAYQEYLKREADYLEQTEVRLQKAHKEPERQKAELFAALQAVEAKINDIPQHTTDPRLVQVEEKLRAIARERDELQRELGKVEGQIQLLDRQSQSTAGTTSKKAIEYAVVKEFTNAIEQTVTQASTSSDVHILRKALSDVSRRCRSFFEQNESTQSHVEIESTKLLQELRVTQAAHIHSLDTFQKNEAVLRKELQALHHAEAERQSADKTHEHERFRLSTELADVERRLTGLEVERQALDRDTASWRQELQEAVALIGRAASGYRDVTFTDNTPDTDRGMQYDRRHRLEKLKIRLEEIGTVDPEVEKEYKNTKERDEFLAGEINDLTLSVGKLDELIADLTSELNTRFEDGVKRVDVEFRRFFTLMFGGGEAQLEKVALKTKTDEDEETIENGLEVAVKLPNKKVSGLEMLSGGERALTSIALIFAMSQVNPPLFIILDETDAALDEANSRRYGDMIEALAKKSQLILITHNRETMSRASVLYGVTMAGDGVSKLLSVKLDQAVEHAK